MSYNLPFGPADILLPKCDVEHWACIACDQYTSQREYWQSAYEAVEDKPSCLHITLPEVYLEDEDKSARIRDINNKMREYIELDVFEEYSNALILVERRLSNGKLRRGLVGAFALDDYSFEAGAKCRIRPTEGTVLSRIPPRVEIRRDALLELPHIMILMDDGQRRIIEGLDTANMKKIYDAELMMNGGHITGWLLNKSDEDYVLAEISDLLEAIEKEGDNMLFAVGDGNHSLATAKASADIIGTEKAKYALAELVSVHSEAVEFEPIYRVLFNVDVNDVIKSLTAAFPCDKGREVQYIYNEGRGKFFVDGLETDVLQRFIDEYIIKHPNASVDYIHGLEAVEELSSEDRTVGFVYNGIDKNELFSYVRENGIFPRKTFSIGEADDKRYYMEARRIR